MTGYTPIAEYGLIGDGATCALVSRAGSIDWFPVPHVESPAAFGAILDAERGGHFSIRPLSPFEATQEYVESTNVLRTMFRTDAGTLVLTDFMPIDGTETTETTETAETAETGPETDDAHADTTSAGRSVYREAACVDGEIKAGVEFAPRFGFAGTDVTIEAGKHDLLARANDGDDTFALSAPVSSSLSFDVTDTATASTTLSAGESAWLVLDYDRDDREASDSAVTEPVSVPPIDAHDAERRLANTLTYWREWSHDCGEGPCVFGGPWHDLAVRSGLVLKLLAHRDSGAIAAAPTTSLPEVIGGVRNWDYRFSWLRDGAFTIQALSNLGHREEARAFLSWFRDLCHENPADIKPLYGLHGEAPTDERELTRLSGYENSKPVRVGNGARDQLQLDVFGELLLATHETTNGGADLQDSEWSPLRAIVDHVCTIWNQPDEGIWEVRCDPKQFVFSKVMCWVALDRGIEIARKNGFDAPVDDWCACRR